MGEDTGLLLFQELVSQIMLVGKELREKTNKQ